MIRISFSFCIFCKSSGYGEDMCGYEINGRFHLITTTNWNFRFFIFEGVFFFKYIFLLVFCSASEKRPKTCVNVSQYFLLHLFAHWHVALVCIIWNRNQIVLSAVVNSINTAHLAFPPIPASSLHQCFYPPFRNVCTGTVYTVMGSSQ